VSTLEKINSRYFHRYLPAFGILAGRENESGGFSGVIEAWISQCDALTPFKTEQKNLTN
jgi:hypothetical protein